MYLLFETAGKFQAGRILSETDRSAQVELDTGKRVKVKLATQLLRFAEPAPAQFLEQAEAGAAEVDPALAWEFAPEDDFGFADLAADYFGADPSPVQQAAALLALHAVPHYFRRAGKGRFRKAPADLVAKALAAIEKRRQLEAQIEAWAQDLAARECPPPVREQMYRILFKPDKNAPEYKAVARAARSTQQTPLALLTQAGAIDSPYQFHWQRFLFENFPSGTDFPPLPEPVPPEQLPLAAVHAFSIDDAQTTEIDDALSVQGLGTGTATIGIHIAAPGLAMRPGDAMDKVARQRMSTVYMPGYKITMLPQAWVDAHALLQGHAVPVVSLYLELDEHSLELRRSKTRLERLDVAANLRHEQVQGLFESDAGAEPADADPADALPFSDALRFLWRLATHLKAGRERMRGKPETYTRPDYSFRLDSDGSTPPTGEETVHIASRLRGAPADLIVSELMVLANSSWGEWLRQLGVPGIYRSQAALAPGVKVRMGTRALPHAGIGVASYCWSTSPLRRYVDLVNQWQIIAAVQNRSTAALAAPFQPRDSTLLTIISTFETAYGAYGRHQASMERYWTLRYLEQEGIRELDARILRSQDGATWLARATHLPLVLSVLGDDRLTPGTGVRIRLGTPDLVALDLHGTVVATLDDDDHYDATPEDSDDDDSDTPQLQAGPIDVTLDDDEGETNPQAETTPSA